MAKPIDDGVPFHLSPDAAFVIAEILEHMAPSGADEYDRIAAVCDQNAAEFEGGPALAHEVATELRRRAQALRDAC